MRSAGGFGILGLIILLPSLFVSPNSYGQTQVAIHATQAEVEVWKNRAQNGPYKDEWNRILSRADDFVAVPDTRWKGQTTDVCYDRDVTPAPSRKLDRGLRDAGFVYLITGNTSYRDAVRKALLAQVVEVGTDFSKRARWCGSSRGLFDVSSWVRRLAYGYSYVRSALSQEDRDTLDKWFLNGGNYFKDVLHETIARRFPKRLDDNYSTCASESFCPGKDRGLTHYGGYQTKNFQLAWNNQMAATAACLGAIAVLLDNGTLKSHAKRFVKEWLKYGVFPGGQIFDQMRWNTGYTPEHGYVYPGTAIGSIISIVDHLARAGDSELYEYSTSDGIYGTAGGSKSLLSVLRHFAGQTNGDVVEYASTGPASDPNLIIDTGSTNFNMVTFVVLAPANIYYKDPELKRAYKTPIPSTYHTGGYDPLGGDWGSYPSIRFMFGEREQIAWPYASSLMSAPEHFRIVKGQS